MSPFEGFCGNCGQGNRSRGPGQKQQGHDNLRIRLEAVVIEARHLSKRYGSRLAVDDLSFTVQPGKVTSFLGPNGAGKPGIVI